ncbi:MAG: DUF5049 domain-containing protein [Oscillospiraceae bacterium]|nr:DUF5049 domain-containing protein [Oscillospiraceae bacterium]
MTDTLIQQIKTVAQTGRCNMFSIQEVFEVAFELGFIEMCDFIFLDTRAYSNFILMGESED